MLFNILRGHKGNTKETVEVPSHLLAHALKHAEPGTLQFEEGEECITINDNRKDSVRRKSL